MRPDRPPERDELLLFCAGQLNPPVSRPPAFRVSIVCFDVIILLIYCIIFYTYFYSKLLLIVYWFGNFRACSTQY